MKLRKILLVAAFALPVLWVFGTKAYHKKVPMVYYENTHGVCTEVPLPIKCVGGGTTICLVGGPTYFVLSTCNQAVTYTP
ncbi:MAG TPA: hypothetical protein VMH27_05350 [Puia sp.]|nr:hypothetical protein [Puia sp.]